MKAVYLKFALSLTLMSAILYGIGIGLGYLREGLIAEGYTYSIAFYTMLNVLIFIVMADATTGRFVKFTNYFMISSLFKLLLILMFVLIYVFNFRDNIVLFVINTFILYIFYTVFEVYWLLKIQHML